MMKRFIYLHLYFALNFSLFSQNRRAQMQNERGRECARRLQCRHKQTNATHATKTRRHATRALQAKNKMK